MPFYEYECKACGHVFELLIRANGGSEASVCPACGSMETRRLLSATACLGGSSDTAGGGGCVPRGGFG